MLIFSNVSLKKKEEKKKGDIIYACIYNIVIIFIFIFLCVYSILSTSVPADQSVSIFTGVFVIVWMGAAIVTLNAKLLGGSV